jgi:DNA-binding NtrC family response regulator
MHGELGTESQVEVSAVGNCDVPDSIGLLMRDVTRRLPSPHDDDQLRAALQSSTEQIGRTPLRSLVKNTVGIVEEHFMRAALELSGNNRTAAAEMLGLSRQSLYSKLNRYGLEENKSAIKPTDD